MCGCATVSQSETFGILDCKVIMELKPLTRYPNVSQLEDGNKTLPKRATNKCGGKLVAYNSNAHNNLRVTICGVKGLLLIQPTCIVNMNHPKMQGCPGWRLCDRCLKLLSISHPFSISNCIQTFSDTVFEHAKTECSRTMGRPSQNKQQWYSKQTISTTTNRGRTICRTNPKNKS